jgi:hypothetical protein
LLDRRLSIRERTTYRAKQNRSTGHRCRRHNQVRSVEPVQAGQRTGSSSSRDIRFAQNLRNPRCNRCRRHVAHTCDNRRDGHNRVAQDGLDEPITVLHRHIRHNRSLGVERRSLNASLT